MDSVGVLLEEFCCIQGSLCWLTRQKCIANPGTPLYSFLVDGARDDFVGLDVHVEYVGTLEPEAGAVAWRGDRYNEVLSNTAGCPVHAPRLHVVDARMRVGCLAPHFAKRVISMRVWEQAGDWHGELSYSTIPSHLWKGENEETVVLTSAPSSQHSDVDAICVCATPNGTSHSYVVAAHGEPCGVEWEQIRNVDPHDAEALQRARRFFRGVLWRDPSHETLLLPS